MRELHFGATAGEGIKTPSSRLGEQRPKGKEPSLEVGARQRLAQGQTYSPLNGRLATGLGSDSGPLAHRALG